MKKNIISKEGPSKKRPRFNKKKPQANSSELY
jgi:hypothetical protein